MKSVNNERGDDITSYAWRSETKKNIVSFLRRSNYSSPEMQFQEIPFVMSKKRSIRSTECFKNGI